MWGAGFRRCTGGAPPIERERERERVSVCVCVCERERVSEIER